MWIEKQFRLKSRNRGFHLITNEILDNIPEIKQLHIGICSIFIQHTSASLTINENADPTVRMDFETFFNYCVPESFKQFKHTLEGSDDMPAHIKASILGHSIVVPVSNGRLSLGTWQGIYLGEHRNNGGSRNIIAILNGE